MSEVSSIFGSATTDLVKVALNAALARHNAIATNIANVNSDGYQPVRIRFDEQLAMAQDQLMNRRYDASSKRTIESLGASMAVVEDPTLPKVQLDHEVGRLAQNAVHYQALLSAKGKLTAITRMAISGGK